jgi:integrase
MLPLQAVFNRAFEATKLRRLTIPVSLSPVSVVQEGGSNMQDGSVTVERRKRGPDVWCFRWREGGPDGRRIHRRIVLGTADDLKGIASARKAVVGLRREINLNDVRIRRESITLADLSRHFQQRELVRGNTRIAYSTRKAHEGYLKKWIEPRWGEYRLLEIRAVEVESWLKSLNRVPGTRCKIRNVMSLLFNHGRRHDLCDRNPIQWVRQGAKRCTAADILTRDEVQGLLANLRFRERTLVLLAVTTGLRRSELFALKWRDVDFQAKQIHVTRSIGQNVIGACKTETSQKPVPAHDDLVKALREWHRQTPYQSSESWVFASPVNQGLAFLGPGDHAAPYHSGCAKTGYHKANRLAYFSSHLFDAASIYRCRAEDHARAAAPFDNSCDSRYIQAGSHNGKAKRAGGSGCALVPEKTQET